MHAHMHTFTHTRALAIFRGHTWYLSCPTGPHMEPSVFLGARPGTLAFLGGPHLGPWAILLDATAQLRRIIRNLWSMPAAERVLNDFKEKFRPSLRRAATLCVGLAGSQWARAAHAVDVELQGIAPESARSGIGKRTGMHAQSNPIFAAVYSGCPPGSASVCIFDASL